jgi:hypothetical protein
MGNERNNATANAAQMAAAAPRIHAGVVRPEEQLPPEHACWVPVPKTWRAMGIDVEEIPESTMASEVGQIPIDGGNFLPFLTEYRMIVDGAADAIGALAKRHPQYAELLTDAPRSRTAKRVRT